MRSAIAHLLGIEAKGSSAHEQGFFTNPETSDYFCLLVLRAWWHMACGATSGLLRKMLFPQGLWWTSQDSRSCALRFLQEKR